MKLRAAGPMAQGGGLENQIHGLVLGAAIGDAMGGPIEFQPVEKVRKLPLPTKEWRGGEQLDVEQCSRALDRLQLRSYNDLRPGTESYGQWNDKSLPGTITDDTRHKLILLHALHKADARSGWPLSVKDLAQAYLDWPKTKAVVGRSGYDLLAKDWLEEWQFAARWVLGQRDLNKALPPERMWQSLPTCCGQMTLLPLAALYPGQPEQAYLAAYQLSFFDNGFGKDLNAALIAGLADALTYPITEKRPREGLERFKQAMRKTDPLRFGSIRWSERAVDRWLNLAIKLAQESKGEPARLYEFLEATFEHTTKWEAQVPFVVAFACLELAEGDPLVALQLSMEWGHDTDSYASVVGAVVGAIHGAGIFKDEWKHAVVTRLLADHGVNLNDESRFLLKLATSPRRQTWVRWK